MTRRWLLLLTLFAATTAAHAQTGNTLTIRFAGAPSGTCAPFMLGINNATGAMYDCLTGSWNLVGGGGGGTGTVTSVGLTVNSGSSSGALAITGSPVTTSGTLNLSWTGTNGDVMTFGASNAPTDSGTLLSSLAPKASPTFTGTVTLPLTSTTTNCAAAGSAASPSAVACSAAPSGSFSCATNASGATCVVSTTAVTANSRIFIQPSAAEGSNLSVTCNTTSDTSLTAPRLASKSAGTSFTINLGTYTTNPECFNYWIVN